MNSMEGRTIYTVKEYNGAMGTETDVFEGGYDIGTLMKFATMLELTKYKILSFIDQHDEYNSEDE